MLGVEASEPAGGAATGTGERSRGRGAWRVDALALGVIAVVLRLPALFATRSLVFDDGVFASSALAMRNGEAPFRSVFSSQGPLFLPLVWLADLLGFRTLDAPRLLPVAAGVLVTIATYACARHITTRGNAWLAAVIVTTSGSILWVTAPVNADGPSLALAVLAVAFALRYRERPRPLDAVWVGLAAGGALSIKVLTIPAVVIAGLIVLVSHRRVRDAFTAAGVAAVVYLVTALPWGIASVWDQSVAYHQEARQVNTHAQAVRKIVTTLWDRDLLVVVALALALVALLVRAVARRRAEAAPSAPRVPRAPRNDDLRVTVAGLALWAFLVFALLVWEPAMWRAHVAHLVVPLALLAALRPPPWKVMAIAGLIAVPIFVAGNTAILWPAGYAGHEAALVRRLQRYPSDARFISDDPGWVWRSGHSTPGNFADTSYQRIDDGAITERSLAHAAASPDVCGVVSSSATRFQRFPGLPDALAAEGFEPVHFGPKITLYARANSGNCPVHG
jgi:4-amino-4-deoxy-L-arabinose transferase-like glycosyltransferase